MPSIIRRCSRYNAVYSSLNMDMWKNEANINNLAQIKRTPGGPPSKGKGKVKGKGEEEGGREV